MRLYLEKDKDIIEEDKDIIESFDNGDIIERAIAIFEAIVDNSRGEDSAILMRIFYNDIVEKLTINRYIK